MQSGSSNNVNKTLLPSFGLLFNALDPVATKLSYVFQYDYISPFTYSDDVCNQTPQWLHRMQS
jgi:hypothetical protein